MAYNYNLFFPKRGDIHSRKGVCMRSYDGIASRVGRIISGSAKKVVEILESATPEIVMEEAINEIDGAIFEVRGELGKLEAERHLANKQISDAESKLKTLSNQIEIALDEGRDDLAEAAVQRQIDIESQLPILKKSVTEPGETISELTNYITALQAKKREMRDELREWRKSKEIAEKVAQGTKESPSTIDARVARAENAFDRIISKSTSSRIDANHASKLAELEELARDTKVKERLSQIKAKRSEVK